RHTRFSRDWSSDVCSSDLHVLVALNLPITGLAALIQGVTVGASVATAVALPPLVPKVVALFDAAQISERRRKQLEATQSEKLREIGRAACRERGEVGASDR